MKYDLLRVLGSSRWMIPAAEFRKLVESVAGATPESITATIAARGPDRVQPEIVGSTAIIDVSGPITYRNTFFSRYFGSATIETMQAQLRAALADDSVANILWRVDSPGGVVDMVPEFATEVFKARGRKPMIAVVDTLMASAAAWIGFQADQVVAPSSAQVGSVGCYLMHQDVSKMLEDFGVKVTFITAGEGKVEGNPYEPLSAEAQARFQEEVDEVYAQFVASVARARNVTAAAVRKEWKAHVYGGDKALALKMIDKRATFLEVLDRMSKQRAVGARIAASAVVAELPEWPLREVEAIESIEPVEDVVADAPKVGETTETDAVSADQIQADVDSADAAIKIAEALGR